MSPPLGQITGRPIIQSGPVIHGKIFNIQIIIILKIENFKGWRCSKSKADDFCNISSARSFSSHSVGCRICFNQFCLCIYCSCHESQPWSEPCNSMRQLEQIEKIVSKLTRITFGNELKQQLERIQSDQDHHLHAGLDAVKHCWEKTQVPFCK